MKFEDVDRAWGVIATVLLVAAAVLMKAYPFLDDDSSRVTPADALMIGRTGEAIGRGELTFVSAAAGDSMGPLSLLEETACLEEHYGFRRLDQAEVDSFNAAVPPASRVTPERYAQLFNLGVHTHLKLRTPDCRR
ncbi:MAG: hypothetical protein AAGE01_06440 [Pseudomonadota bacterium]